MIVACVFFEKVVNIGQNHLTVERTPTDQISDREKAICSGVLFTWGGILFSRSNSRVTR